MLKKLFQKKPKKLTPVTHRPRDKDKYEAEKNVAKSTSSDARVKLARNPKTHLEILFYLADDEDVRVRRAVAANPATPVQVSENLAKDVDIDVKVSLIERLGALLPALSEEQHAHLYAFAVQALGVLALDEVLKVRLALTSVLRDHAYAPPDIARQLARDVEREVSEPILRYCAALSDEDLLDILSEHPDDWVVTAVASRGVVDEPVSDGVIETGSQPGGRALLSNKGAKISDETMHKIITIARETPEWHKPLALRKHLSRDIIQDIMVFIDKSLHKMVLNNTDFDSETRKMVRETVGRRMGFLVGKDGGRIDPRLKAQKLFKQEQLDDDAVGDALALREYDFVIYALSLKTGLDEAMVKHILDTKSAKALTALVWKAGLGMRLALEMQKQMLKLSPRDLLYPRAGSDFPLSEEDMQWQIEFFTD